MPKIVIKPFLYLTRLRTLAFQEKIQPLPQNVIFSKRLSDPASASADASVGSRLFAQFLITCQYRRRNLTKQRRSRRSIPYITLYGMGSSFMCLYIIPYALMIIYGNIFSPVKIPAALPRRVARNAYPKYFPAIECLAYPKRFLMFRSESSALLPYGSSS